MPFCYFSKVNEGTSWSDLKVNKQLQTSRECKKTEYSELVALTVDQKTFDDICNDVSCTKDWYQKYTHQSIATLDGKWKCIVVKKQQSEQKIILYTAGCIYPLYAAICE